MIWWIALGIVSLIAILPVGISGIYDESGPLVRLIIGPVRLLLYPTKPKENKEQIKDKQPRKTASQATINTEKEKKGGSISDFKPIIELVLEFLGALKRKLRVNFLQLKLVLAGDDPCDVAVNYGKAWAAVGNLMPHLERIFVIKKRDVEVACDFSSDKTLITARVDLTITVGRLIILAVNYGGRGLREFLKLMKKSKGGAIT